MKRLVPDRLGGDTFKPIANDVIEDVSNVGTMGPIHPDVGAVTTTGVAPAGHPELADGHRDVKLAKLADLSGETTVGHDSSATDTLAARTPATFTPSSQLHPK